MLKRQIRVQSEWRAIVEPWPERDALPKTNPYTQTSKQQKLAIKLILSNQVCYYTYPTINRNLQERFNSHVPEQLKGTSKS